jgi:hypothetical protein
MILLELSNLAKLHATKCLNLKNAGGEPPPFLLAFGTPSLGGHRRITSKITPRVLKPKWWRGAG